jgi:hypothetical protein
MYCANCGTENDDDVAFCSKCGKSPTDAAVENKNSKMANYPLINLSSKLFYPMFEMGLWILLIIGTMGGGIAGYYIGRSIDRYDGGGPGVFLGIIIGFIVSFLGMVNSGGLISIFLKMNENIEKLERK